MTATATVPPIETAVPGLKTRVPAGTFRATSNALLGVGAVAVIASAVTAFFGEDARKQFYFSYLVAYTFALGIVLGAMFFVLVQHLARAGWSVVVRRVAENIMGAMPLMVPLFLPIVLGYHDLYHHWVDAVVDPLAPGYDKILAGKRAWLNEPSFFARIVVYFLIWTLIATWFRKKSLEQDRTGDPALTLKMARAAAPVMLLYALTVTFAAIDWLKSLDPHWFSTMWGVYIFAGYVVSFFGVTALLCMWLQKKNWLKDAVTVEHYHDIGKLLFAFMVFWAYTGFSQYMLIWYANLPEETIYYAHRAEGSWYEIGQLMIVGHFLVPFVFLMSRHMKRNRRTLAIGALILLAIHFIDLHWIVMPTLHHHGVHLSWVDFATLIGLVGLLLGVVLRNIESTPLVPERDPRLVESLHFHNI